MSEEIHVVDEISGATYRNILSELIELKSKIYIEVPEARGFLEFITADELNQLEEQVKGLIHYWMPSAYESSSLVNLKITQFDQATSNSIQNDIEQFLLAEERRIACLEQTSSAFDGSKAQHFGDWLDKNGEKIKNISENDALNIQQWFDLLHDEYNDTSIAQDISKALDKISEHVGALITSLRYKHFSESLQKLEDEELEKLANSCSYFLSTSFFKFLNPFGLVHNARLKKILKAQQIRLKSTSVQELTASIEQEQSFRNYRIQFFKLLDKLKVNRENITEVKFLRVKIGSISNELKKTIEWV